MQYHEYPKTPKVRLHITSVVIFTILCGLFLYFVNPSAGLTDDDKRKGNRIAAMTLMVGSLLGGVGVLSLRDIKKKGVLAQAHILTHTAAISTMETQVSKKPDLKLALEQHRKFLDAAKRAKTDVDQFDETAAKIGMWGLAFLVIGTLILQVTA